MKEIRKILKTYDTLDHQSTKCALATVVHIEESSYRRIGARMLVMENGEWVGGISGGCLEGDALKRAKKALLDRKVSRAIYDTREEDHHQIGIGLGCNGKIEVLFVPIDHNDLQNPINQLRKVTAFQTHEFLFQIIESHDRKYLGQCYLHEDLPIFISEKIDHELLQSTLLACKRKRQSQIISLADQKEKELKILLEYHRPETRLIIIGDNYDVNALVQIAHVIGWHIYLVGKKGKYNKNIFRLAQKIINYDQFEELRYDEFTAIVLMTHDYNKDLLLLKSLLSKKSGYLGILGPRKRMMKLKSQLGLSDQDIKSIYSPVGLDIGADSPEEIALSIASEITAVFKNREGSSLKNRKGPIHS